MTPDLTYLALTALLTGALWIPYIVGQVSANGFLAAENYKDPTPRPVPLWAQRANRAHINSVETFAPVAALVLIAHVAGASSTMTAVWTALFFWTRLVHAVVYILGIPYLRTAIFAIGFLSVLGLTWEVVT